MQLTRRRGNGLLAAALALPGLAATVPAARAEAPTEGEVAFRYTHYQDFQPRAERMRVVLPALFVLLPVNERWSMRGAYSVDAISGASPLFHDTLSGASTEGVEDIRRSGELEVTRHFERAALAVGATASDEDDYDSLALRAVATFDSADRNTTWSFGAGYADDSVDSTNGVAVNEDRRTRDLNVGVTRVLTPRDVVHASIGLALGDGYYDDPYKPIDFRPGSRDERTLSFRWNHFVERFDAALRLSYRIYDDSWDVTAHSVQAEWEQPLGSRGWALTPSLRFHDQSAASFYSDPPFGAGFVPGESYTTDTRLSAFGAWAATLKLDIPLGERWGADFKFQFYRQRGSWRMLGDGSPDVEPVSARIFELGIRRTF